MNALLTSLQRMRKEEVVLEFRSDGRKVTQAQWMKDLERDALDQAMKTIADKIHGIAASIIDPETGKHPVVSVRPIDDTHLNIRTEGSKAFVQLFNEQLAKNCMPVLAETNEKQDGIKLVYFAHASEDKYIAKPIVDQLLASGIDVWFDEWEILSGDSLRRKIDEGLGDCTHFVVLLTETSINKRWVQEEIDAAFVEKVEGRCKFISLRFGIGINRLSPLLKSARAPEIDPDDPATIAALRDDILGISRKPALGALPQYLQACPKGPEGWSKAAIAVARMFVTDSDHALSHDPALKMEKIKDRTDLSEESVRDGLLDLADRGLVRKYESSGGTSFWAEASLFVEFDRYFMDWDPKDDGLVIAREVVNTGDDSATTEELAKRLDWPPRRMNSALYYLDEAHLIKPRQSMGSQAWSCRWFYIDDRTRRFVRENA